MPGAHFANYNNEILSVADSWLGNPWETIFSVNCILIDEKNITKNKFKSAKYEMKKDDKNYFINKYPNVIFTFG